MAIQIVQGASKNLIVRITNGDTGDPFDLTGCSYIKACFVGDSASVNAFYLTLLGDTLTGSNAILNINPTNIQLGDPISGPGIPSGSVVTDTSINNLTLPANSIKISQNATVTATQVAIIDGSVSIVSATLGKINIGLTPAQTALISTGDTQDFQVTFIDSLGNTSIVQFAASLQVLESLC